VRATGPGGSSTSTSSQWSAKVGPNSRNSTRPMSPGPASIDGQCTVASSSSQVRRAGMPRSHTRDARAVATTVEARARGLSRTQDVIDAISGFR
jgi:hypothetical protein